MAKIKGREVRDVARERLEKLDRRSNESKQISDRQRYEREGNVKRGKK